MNKRTLLVAATGSLVAQGLVGTLSLGHDNNRWHVAGLTNAALLASVGFALEHIFNQFSVIIVAFLGFHTVSPA